MIGIPFLVKDEKLKKYIDKLDRKESEAFALDKDGRRRFHGAFTGGFSAGYWNTCGSKEGWVPAEFKSSRLDQQSHQKQTILDFMDQEDLGEHVAGQTITANQNYQDTTGEIEKKLLHARLGNHSVLGYKLLKKIGWKQSAQENGSEEEEDQISDQDLAQVQEMDERQDILAKLKALKKEREQPQKAKKNKYYSGPLRPKVDRFGIGYIPTQEDLKGLATENFDLSGAKSSNPMHLSRFQSDDVYQEENKQEFLKFENDIAAAPQSSQKKKNPPRDELREPHFFFKGTIHSNQIKELKVELPQDYEPFKHKVSVTESSLPGRFGAGAKPLGAVTRKRYVQDPMIRRKLIEDQEQSEEEQEEFITPLVSNKARKLPKRFYKDASSVPLPKTSSLQTRFMEQLPFLRDKEKMARFEAFVADKEGQYYQPVFGNMMKASELKREKEEFQRLYDRNQKLKKLKHQRGDSPVKQEAVIQLPKQTQLQEKLESLRQNKSTRQFIDWNPSQILCKRFGVISNKKQKRVVEEGPQRKKQEFVSGEVINKNSGNQFFDSIAEAVKQQNQQEQEVSQEPQQQIIIEENALQEKKSIFKAIFSDESDQE